MKKYLLISLMTLVALSVLARRAGGLDKIEYPGGKCFFYRLYLTDKNNSKYSVDRPEEFLTNRSIERRKKQKIEVNETDLPVSDNYINLLREKGFEVIRKSKWNNTVVIRVSSNRALKKLDEFSFVKDKKLVFESPDSIGQRTRSNIRNKFNRWEYQESQYGATASQIESLDGISLHESGYRGKGMMIAVLDGGFMNVDKIPALHNIRLAGLEDFVVPKSKNMFNEMDHGTMVLSAMAVNQPNYYVGTAPEASYILIRCEDERSEFPVEEDYWAEAVEYADSLGVDVINSSLGYHEFDDHALNHTYCEQDGEQALISHTASMLAAKGVVLVNSAGNDGMGTWKKINFPADAKDILTVGSVNDKGINAPFSALGPTADGRIKPDVMAYGSPASVLTGRGTIVNDMGTSFSAPLVAGMVACLWQALPNKTAVEIIELVKQSSNRYDQPDNVYGYGVPDFWKAYQMGKKQK